MGGRGSGRRAKVLYLPNADRDPWGRQDGETDPAWLAAKTYIDLGPEKRSHEQVVISLGKRPCYRALLERWSVRWGWRGRAEAWDRHVDEVQKQEQIKARIEAIKKTTEEMATTAEALWKLAARDLRSWHRKLEQEEKEAKKAGRLPEPSLSPSDLQRLADTGMKLHRLALGEPESIQEQRHELTVDEKRRRAQRILSDPETRVAAQAFAKKLGESEPFVLDAKLDER